MVTGSGIIFICSTENYIQNNINDLKSIRKGIKKFISLKEMSNIASSNYFDNGRSLTEQIANAFNKYFVKVAADIKSSIRYSKNSFHDFLPPINIKSSSFSTPLIKLKLKYNIAL